MKTITQYMTRNDCYIDNVSARKKPANQRNAAEHKYADFIPKGIIIHSTATPGVYAADWFSRLNKSFRNAETDRRVCVHAFVDDKDAYNYLPWSYRGWHGGSGDNGSVNDTHIGIEICEPAGFSYEGNSMQGYKVEKQKPYFDAAYRNAVDLAVSLCREFKLSAADIMDHSEAHARGLASNHGDVGHWFPKHNRNMNTFRADVKYQLSIFDMYTIEENCDRLAAAGVIKSPDYWIKNAIKDGQCNGEYVAALISNTAAYIRKKEGK